MDNEDDDIHFDKETTFNNWCINRRLLLLRWTKENLTCDKNGDRHGF